MTDFDKGESFGAHKAALAAVDSGGGLVSLENPYGEDCIVTRFLINLRTASTGACTGNFGVTPTSAITDADNLIDGQDLNAAPGLFDNIDEQGTNGKARQLWPAGSWLTGSVASGASAGLVGEVYIETVLVGDNS